jgi:Xaa-Pro aminopeptidase
MLLNGDRALEIMSKYRLDALIGASPENISYLSDFLSVSPYVFRSTQLFVILPFNNDTEPALILPRSMLSSLVELPTWIKDIRSYGKYYIAGPYKDSILSEDEESLFALRERARNYSGPLEALLDTLKEKGLKSGNLGFDERGMSYDTIKNLESQKDIRFIRASDVFSEIRMIKTQDEIQYLKKAAEINVQGMKAILSKLREGVSEGDIVQAHKTKVVELGADYLSSGITGMGPRSASLFPSSTSNYLLKRGDLIRMEVSCIFQRYWSDSGRTAVCGPANKKQLAYYDAILQGHMAMLDQVREGVKVSQICKIGTDTISSKGIPQFERNHCGHGTGLEIYEPPLITQQENLELKANMVINIEPPYYELGFGGLQIEDTIVVTKSGFEFLTNMGRELFVID